MTIFQRSLIVNNVPGRSDVFMGACIAMGDSKGEDIQVYKIQVANESWRAG